MEILSLHNVSNHLLYLYQNTVINECDLENQVKSHSPGFFWWDVEELMFLTGTLGNLP